VTDDAFEVFKFVLYKCLIAFCDLLMTSFTGNVCVLALEFESGFIVVEFPDLPTFVVVAGRTIGHSGFFKLPVMTVFMATGTGGR